MHREEEGSRRGGGLTLLHARQRSLLHVSEASVCTYLHLHTHASYIYTCLRMMFTYDYIYTCLRMIHTCIHIHALRMETHVHPSIHTLLHPTMPPTDIHTCSVCVRRMCVCVPVSRGQCLFVALTWEVRGVSAAGNVVPAPKDAQCSS